MARKKDSTPSTPSSTPFTEAKKKKPSKDKRKLTGDDKKDFEALLATIEASRSTAWLGYTAPKLCLDIERTGEPDDDGRLAAMVQLACLGCGLIKTPQVNDGALSNLKTHSTSCKSQQDALKTSRTLNELGFVEEEASQAELLQTWIIECCRNGRPFAMVDDDELQPLLSTTARTFTPDATTIARGVEELFKYGGEAMKKELAVRSHSLPSPSRGIPGAS